MPRTAPAALLALAALIALPALASGPDAYAAIESLARTVALIQRSWVEEISTAELVEAGLDGMTHRLDPWSDWMSPDDLAAAQEALDGRFVGIGVGLEGAHVRLVVPGSPAEREGLLPGDVLVAVDDRPVTVAGRVDADAIQGLSGPRGEVVRVLIRRAAWPEPREIAIHRDEIHAPSLELARMPGDVVWVHLLNFQRGAAGELDAALAAQAPYAGLILDVRDNPGGLLEEAIPIVDRFLASGLIVETRSRIPTENKQVQAQPGGPDERVPLAVLVNGRSASASEIVAAALHDHGRATLVGTPTYGKGTVQTFFPQRDGSAVKLTIARWLGPSGAPISRHDGRTPPIAVAWPTDNPSPEEALRRALRAMSLPTEQRDLLLSHVDALAPAEPDCPDQAVPWSEPADVRLATDPQLRAALDHLAAQAR
jgi:carboxyl-terminal processing protease